MAPLMLATLLLAVEYQAQYTRDFRRQGFDDQELRLVGEVGKPMVKPEPGGLRITIPRLRSDLKPVGFLPQFWVRGDFEITLTYEILSRDVPSSGSGIGVSLYLVSNSPSKEAVHLARSLRPSGRHAVATTRMTSLGTGRKAVRSRNFPAYGTSGRLRCTRTGSTVHYAMAEGDAGDFLEIDQDELGPEDLTMVRVAAENGSSPDGIDVRIADFTVRAEALPGPSTAQPPPEPLPVAWLAGIPLVLVFFAGVWYRRANR